MNILVEVLRWSFMGGVCVVLGILAFVGGLVATLMVWYFVSDMVCRAVSRIRKSKDGKA